MSDEKREMTLREWVERLPGIHAARKEYIQLCDSAAELTQLRAEKKQLQADNREFIEEALELKQHNERLRGLLERAKGYIHWKQDNELLIEISRELEGER